MGYPEGLAFGPDNQLYVASNSQNRIQRFDASTGAFLSTFVNNTPTGFEPTFLAFGALPTIRWNNPVSVSFGSALSSAQLNASANVPGTFVYTPPAGTVLPVGSAQTLSVQFTPALRNYRPSTASVPITVTGGGPATLISTNTLRREAGTNNVIVTVRIANTGGTPATSVVMTSARIGATTAITSLPASVGNIAAGGVSFVMLSFPPSVGAAGARVVLSTGGTYSSGSFGQSARVVLP